MSTGCLSISSFDWPFTNFVIWTKHAKSEDGMENLQINVPSPEDATKLDQTTMRAERKKAQTKICDELQSTDKPSVSKLIVPDGPVQESKQEVKTLKPIEAPKDGHNPETEQQEKIAAPESTPAETAASPNMTLDEKRYCYICKKTYFDLHHFYDQLCQRCGAYNLLKRKHTADLYGKIALVTGGRLKIGFHVVLKLLRAGARVLVTTRFPFDAAQRFGREDDFNQFKCRLEIFGLDFRDLKSVEQFCDGLIDKYSRLDILINNAAQTVRRPNAYYRQLIDLKPDKIEKLPKKVKKLVKLPEPDSGYIVTEPADDQTSELECEDKTPILASNQDAKSEENGLISQVNRQMLASKSALMSQINMQPDGAIRDQSDAESNLVLNSMLDVHGRPLDLRVENSWTLKLHQISTVEAAEVFAINSLAPFILNSRLKPLLARRKRGAKITNLSSLNHLGANKGDQAQGQAKFIVNVSAMEGSFSKLHKTADHPHTNMAKAALNMMTRTSATDYAQEGIYMTSVDTGWINDEAPIAKAAWRTEKYDFQPPLDEIDGAARVLDPILLGFNQGHFLYGVFLKDYNVCDW